MEVLAFMREVARTRGMIIFIAIHDLNQAMRFADHAMVIDRGRLSGVGAVGEVIVDGVAPAATGRLAA